MATIMVIDDDPNFIRTARAILGAQGHRLTSATNGRQALEAMRADRPDLVVLDARISYVVGGPDVAEEMGREPELQDIPIVMVSSLLDPESTEPQRQRRCLTPEETAASPAMPESVVRRVAGLLD